MPKRILEGVVVSDKGDKTVIVKVERTLLHPLLKKTVRRSKRYHAHDESNAYKAGDIAAEILCANEVNGVIDIGQAIGKGNRRLADGF